MLSRREARDHLLMHVADTWYDPRQGARPPSGRMLWRTVTRNCMPISGSCHFAIQLERIGESDARASQCVSPFFFLPPFLAKFWQSSMTPAWNLAVRCCRLSFFLRLERIRRESLQTGPASPESRQHGMPGSRERESMLSDHSSLQLFSKAVYQTAQLRKELRQHTTLGVGAGQSLQTRSELLPSLPQAERPASNYLTLTASASTSSLLVKTFDPL